MNREQTAIKLIREQKDFIIDNPKEIKRYECKICGLKSFDSTVLPVHLRKEHNIYPKKYKRFIIKEIKQEWNRTKEMLEKINRNIKVCEEYSNMVIAMGLALELTDCEKGLEILRGEKVETI